MSRRNLIVAFLFVFVCSLTAITEAAYKVVIKKNQKIFEGEFLREDDTSITIKSAGDQLTFKKSLLDLDKMKELNPPAPTQTSAADENAGRKEPKTLAEIAKENKSSQKGTGKVYSDKDRAASWTLHNNDPEVQDLLTKIKALEDEIDSLQEGDVSSPEVQKIIEDRSKELDNLKYKLELYGQDKADDKANTHAESERLQGQIDSLSSDISQLQGQLEKANASDADAIKKQIGEKQQALAQAQDALAQENAKKQ